MSTRCTIHFHGYGTPDIRAIIYRHCDGYPDGEHGVPADLERFFKEVESQTRDTRFSDPSYLAAKFVVWQAGEFARDDSRPLDFLSVGVVMQDPGDIEYRYHVTCGTDWNGSRPEVNWEKS
jgi:hypothetical protein